MNDEFMELPVAFFCLFVCLFVCLNNYWMFITQKLGEFIQFEEHVFVDPAWCNYQRWCLDSECRL